MNPLYSIMESPHRWAILAGLSLLVGLLGTIFALAYQWPHTPTRLWLILAIAAAAYFLLRGLLDWKSDVTEAFAEQQRKSSRPPNATS